MFPCEHLLLKKPVHVRIAGSRDGVAGCWRYGRARQASIHATEALVRRDEGHIRVIDVALRVPVSREIIQRPDAANNLHGPAHGVPYVDLDTPVVEDLDHYFICKPSIHERSVRVTTVCSVFES